MAQKRVLLIGTMLVSAAIGVPTMAMLAPGGVTEGPSAVEPVEPEAAAPEPLDQDALPMPVTTLPTDPAQSRRAPANSGEEVPSHLGETALPQRTTTTAPPRKPVLVPAAPGEPQAPQPQPAEPEEESTVVPPPTLPSDPDDADTDHPSPPGGPVPDDHDPSDEGDDPADS